MTVWFLSVDLSWKQFRPLRRNMFHVSGAKRPLPLKMTQKTRLTFRTVLSSWSITFKRLSTKLYVQQQDAALKQTMGQLMFQKISQFLISVLPICIFSHAKFSFWILKPPVLSVCPSCLSCATASCSSLSCCTAPTSRASSAQSRNAMASAATPLEPFPLSTR